MNGLFQAKDLAFVMLVEPLILRLLEKYPNRLTLRSLCLIVSRLLRAQNVDRADVINVCYYLHATGIVGCKNDHLAMASYLYLIGDPI